MKCCAALIGRGTSKTAAARVVGVSRRSVSDWARRDDFQKLVQRAREALLDERPTARATLEAALTATKRDGSPDWQTRAQAARALTTGSRGEPSPEPETPRRLTINEDALER